jgi:hypothetical protein
MSPYKNHILRNAKGMCITSEILLDMVDICGRRRPSFTGLKDAAVVDGVCSLPTAHTKLHWLIDNGYLVSEINQHDRRAKILRVTLKGDRYLREVNK